MLFGRLRQPGFLSHLRSLTGYAGPAILRSQNPLNHLAIADGEQHSVILLITDQPVRGVRVGAVRVGAVAESGDGARPSTASSWWMMRRVSFSAW